MPGSSSRFFLDLHHITEMIDRATEISDDAKGLAHKIFLAVAQAEAKVHGSTIEKVHFHEVGALDATALVVAAETWSNAAPAIVDRLEGSEESITATGGTLTVTEASTFIRKLEHVQVTVDLETSRRGQTLASKPFWFPA